MIFFYEWPISWSISSFMVTALGLNILIYLATHWSIRGMLAKSHERTGRVLFRTTASLLALLLSFTFANQRVNHYKIKDSLEAEAAKLVDIMVDLWLYNTDEAKDIQEKIRHYITSMLKEDKGPENVNPLLSGPVFIFISINNSILNLSVTNEKQAQLKSNLLADIDEVSDYMQIRSYRLKPEPIYLIYLATFGFIVSSILFSVYRPDKISIAFFTLYNAFVALVLYFIIMMNNPMIGPFKITNEPFKTVIELANMK